MGVEEIKITGGLCGYETVQKMFREEVTFGVDLARLADWVDQEFAEQKQLISPDIDQAC